MTGCARSFLCADSSRVAEATIKINCGVKGEQAMSIGGLSKERLGRMHDVMAGYGVRVRFSRRVVGQMTRTVPDLSASAAPLTIVTV